jgi:hypothetical protein
MAVYMEKSDFQKSRAYSPGVITQGGKIVWLAGHTATRGYSVHICGSAGVGNVRLFCRQYRSPYQSRSFCCRRGADGSDIYPYRVLWQSGAGPPGAWVTIAAVRTGAEDQ